MGRFVLNLKIIGCLTTLKKSRCNKMMHWNYLGSLHNALDHQLTLKAKSSSFWSISKCRNGSRINASDVLSFDRLLRSLFIHFCLEHPRSHVVVLAKPKLQSMSSRIRTVRIARVIEIWKCLLKCQDWSLAMFLFASCSQRIL